MIKKLPELESEVPEGLKKILSNVCEYDPDFRYQTAEEMKEDFVSADEKSGLCPWSNQG